MSADDTAIDDSLSVRQDSLLDTLPVYIATAMFLLTIVLATIQVLLRQLPVQIEFLFWTEPLARYLLIIMTYLGTAVAVRNNENVKIDLVQRSLQKTRPNLYHVVTVIISLCLLWFVYVVLRGGISSTVDAWGSGTNLPHLTYGMIHATIVISVALMGLYTVYELIPYAKFVASKLRGTDYSLPTSGSGMLDNEPVDQLGEKEASQKAQDLMGLSESDSTDGDDDTQNETDADSSQQSERD